MKKIALSLLIALSCISAKAADGKSLFVSFNDGSKIEFALSTQPEITFGNDKMTVTSTATTASYELWKVLPSPTVPLRASSKLKPTVSLPSKVTASSWMEPTTR